MTERLALTFTDMSGEVVAHFPDAEVSNLTHDGEMISCTVSERADADHLAVSRLFWQSN